jgi:hypothetical protein
MRYGHLILLMAFVNLLHTASLCASYELPPVEKYIPNANIAYYDIRGSPIEQNRIWERFRSMGEE